LRISINNNIALTDIPPEMKSWFIQNLTFDNPKYLEALNHGRYTGNIEKYISMYTSLPTGIIIPRGWLQLVERSFINKGYDVDLHDSRILLEPVDVKSAISLRSYQAPAKFDLLRHPNGILVAPAGSGKTVMGLEVFASLRQRMLWVTHTKRLALQVRERILGTDKDPPLLIDVTKDDIGIIGSGKWKVGDKITIALVQTLVRRPHELSELGREFGLVICDECHHTPATTFLDVLRHFYAYYMYGLTATPYRRDKLENVMFAALGYPNATISRKDVKAASGIMTPKLIVRMVPSPIIEGNDYHQIMEDNVIPNEQRSNMIAEDVVREAKAGNFCIVINTRKAYCEILYEKISRYWAKTGIADGDYGDKHNKKQVERLENNDITVLITTFDLLGEGFDVKKLNRGFIALPFRERTRVEQAVGRIQRTCDGKTDAVIYDYVDNNIGILKNQFRARSFVYKLLGIREAQ
jgi:superfamily II DNA or RNA helicase